MQYTAIFSGYFSVTEDFESLEEAQADLEESCRQLLDNFGFVVTSTQLRTDDDTQGSPVSQT